MIGILRKFDKTWPEIPTLTSSGIKPSLLRTSVLFNLPTEINIKPSYINKIHKGIYDGVFLDKKKIKKNPRYIYLQNIFKPQIREIRNYGLLNDVIFKIIKRK